MDIYSKIVFISRPRIWLYTLGSFLFGVQMAFLLGYAVNLALVLTLCALLTVPVNLFIYALNDYFDADSDAHNPKKNKFEHRSDATNTHLLYMAAVALALISLVMFSQEVLVVKLFVLWLITILTYNIPPLRFKARPGLDMLFSANFPLWGFIGYAVVAHTLPDLSVVIPIAFLSIVFHLYSAINDIPYDKSAGVITSAVYIGSVKKNILLCVLLTIFAIASLAYLGWVWVGIGLIVYVIFFLLHLGDTLLSRDLMSAYRYFIWIHYLIGIPISMSILLYI